VPNDNVVRIYLEISIKNLTEEQREEIYSKLPTEKKCGCCEVVFESRNFSLKKGRYGTWTLNFQSKPCAVKRVTQSRVDDGGRKRLDSDLRRTYGISVEEYDAVLDIQQGTCAICPETVSDVYRVGKIRRLAVDHCHITGKVRGLLCGKCNMSLERFENYAEEMREYLANPPYSRIKLTCSGGGNRRGFSARKTDITANCAPTILPTKVSSLNSTGRLVHDSTCKEPNSYVPLLQS